MTRKKVNKELTIEEQLQQERENELNFIKDEVPHLNEPTYRFEVGEKVKYGALKDCTVKEVLYDGKVYGFIVFLLKKIMEILMIEKYIESLDGLALDRLLMVIQGLVKIRM